MLCLSAQVKRPCSLFLVPPYLKRNSKRVCIELILYLTHRFKSYCFPLFKFDAYSSFDVTETKHFHWAVFQIRCKLKILLTIKLWRKKTDKNNATRHFQRFSVQKTVFLNYYDKLLLKQLDKNVVKTKTYTILFTSIIIKRRSKLPSNTTLSSSFLISTLGPVASHLHMNRCCTDFEVYFTPYLIVFVKLVCIVGIKTDLESFRTLPFASWSFSVT